MASRAIANLRVQLTAVTSAFASKMNGAQKTLRGFQKTSNSVSAAMLKLSGAFAGLVSARAFANFIGDSLKSIDALKDVANKLDISTESLAGLRRAATLSGSSAGALDKALDKMSNSISEANKGSTSLKNTFAELGLNTKELINLNASDQFKAIADAFAGIGNNADKIRLAKDIFGKSGGDLLKTLEEGSGGLDKAIEDARKSGQGVTDEQAEKAQKAMDAIDSLKLAWEGLGVAIAISATDSIIAATEAMNNFVTEGVGGAGKVARAFALVELPLLNAAALISGLAGNDKEVKRIQARIKQLADEEADRTGRATQIPGRHGAVRIGSPNFPPAHILAPGTAAGMRSAAASQAMGPQGSLGTPPNWAEQLARAIAPAFAQHMQRIQGFDPRVRQPRFEPPFQFNYGAGGRMQPQPRGVLSSEERAATSKRSEDARQARIEASNLRQEKRLEELVAIARKGAPAVAQ